MAIVEDLIVSEYGAFVGLHSQRLRVTVKDERIIDAPLMHLRSVQIHTRSASLSAAALAACCEAGIPIHFIDSFQGNYATVLSPHLTTVVETRRHQVAAMGNTIGVQVALQIAAGKLRSQAANLRYLARRQSEECGMTLQQAGIDLLGYADRLLATHAESLDVVRQELMGIEGYCARMYWSALGSLIPETYGWPGRTGRGATDQINTLLNYGYGILYGEVQNALVIAGLEPYVGLVHTDRPGKPSLTLDLIEEFRAPIVDRTVIGLANRQYKVDLESDGRLSRDARKGYAEHILSRLNAQGIHEKKRYSLRSIIQIQARMLAGALRGERMYVSYTGG